MKYSTAVTKRRRRGRLEYIAVLAYYDDHGKRKWKHRSAPSFSEAKRVSREMENEYLIGGEIALQSHG
ncbi:hypothetical protein BH20ACI3_BH20ACI3_32940 [soil metagenome]